MSRREPERIRIERRIERCERTVRVQVERNGLGAAHAKREGQRAAEIADRHYRSS